MNRHKKVNNYYGIILINSLGSEPLYYNTLKSLKNTMLFLIFFLSTSNAIVLISSLCILSSCRNNLEYYIAHLQHRVTFEQVEKEVVVNFLHPKPNDQVSELSVKGYTVDRYTGNRYIFNRLYISEDSTNVNLNMRFTENDILSNQGCIKFSENINYSYYQCLIKLKYISQFTNHSIKTFDFRLTVGIPQADGYDHILGGGPITENDCSCDIISDVKYTTKLYKDANCENEMEAGDEIRASDFLCLEVKAGDPLIKEAELTITSLKVHYNTEAIEIIDLAKVKCGSGDNCEKGIAYVIFQPYKTSLEFSMVIGLKFEGKLSDEKRKGISAKFSRTLIEAEKVSEIGLIGYYEEPAKSGHQSEEDTFGTTDVLAYILAPVLGAASCICGIICVILRRGRF